MTPKQPKKKKGPPLREPAPLDAEFRFPRQRDPLEGADKRLTHQQELFVTEYIKEFNISAAARRAGLSHSECSKLIQEPHIIRRIDDITKLRSEKNIMTGEQVMQFITWLLNADPNALYEEVVGACRRCWGYSPKTGKWNGKYQFDDEAHRERHFKKNGRYKYGDGGVGYDSLRAPNQYCPKCHGRGKLVEIHKDTNSYDAKRMIATVEMGVDSNGRRKMVPYNKERLLEMLARHHGLFEKDNANSGNGTGGNTFVGGIDYAALHALSKGTRDDLEKLIEDRTNELRDYINVQAERPLDQPEEPDAESTETDEGNDE